MQNALAVQVCQTGESLARERRHHRLLKLAVLAQARSDAATRNVLEEDADARLLALAPQVLHDIDVVQVLHRVNLLVERRHHLSHLGLVACRGLRVDLDLLDRQELSGRGVHAEIDAPVSALANQLALEPPERRLPLG